MTSERPRKAGLAGSLIFTATTRNLAIDYDASGSHSILEHSAEELLTVKLMPAVTPFGEINCVLSLE